MAKKCCAFLHPEVLGCLNFTLKFFPLLVIQKWTKSILWLSVTLFKILFEGMIKAWC